MIKQPILLPHKIAPLGIKVKMEIHRMEAIFIQMILQCRMIKQPILLPQIAPLGIKVKMEIQQMEAIFIQTTQL
jgi:hypothetical protein